jgi:hypothetical protein
VCVDNQAHEHFQPDVSVDAGSCELRSRAHIKASSGLKC